MDKLKYIIANGIQIGHSKIVVINRIPFWFDAAIQKYNSSYRVHVSAIKEENMSSENYFTREFKNIEDAFQCIKENSEIKLIELSVIKGQRIFNPKFLEENSKWD